MLLIQKRKVELFLYFYFLIFINFSSIKTRQNRPGLKKNNSELIQSIFTSYREHNFISILEAKDDFYKFGHLFYRFAFIILKKLNIIFNIVSATVDIIHFLFLNYNNFLSWFLEI